MKKETNAQAGDINDMVAMIDGMMERGVGRLKLSVSEDLKAGEVQKQYHHGRCDIGSPYACGTPYDVLEDAPTGEKATFLVNIK
ncbi:MAG: hypothetical protein IJ600_08065 [Lachnospiraceae bacterium]|nr:hypothetical protein [Lachnospiraceae bacterium]